MAQGGGKYDFSKLERKHFRRGFCMAAANIVTGAMSIGVPAYLFHLKGETLGYIVPIIFLGMAVTGAWFIKSGISFMMTQGEVKKHVMNGDMVIKELSNGYTYSAPHPKHEQG